VEIRHIYFENRLCRSLRLTPAKGTQKIVDNTGMILKPEAGRIVVLYEKNRLDAMKMYMDDPFDPLCFYFTGRTSDPVFSNYTEDAGDPPETALFLSTRSGNPDPCCLTRKPRVSIKEHRASTDPVLASAMTCSRIRRPASFFQKKVRFWDRPFMPPFPPGKPAGNISFWVSLTRFRWLTGTAKSVSKKQNRRTCP